MGWLDGIFPFIKRPLTVDGKPETPNGTTPGGRFGPGPVTPSGSLASRAVQLNYLGAGRSSQIPPTPTENDAPAVLWDAAFNYRFMPQVYQPINGGNLGGGYPTVGRVPPVPYVQLYIDPIRLSAKVKKDAPR